MLRLNFTPFPELPTERLLLRAITLADTPVFFRLRTEAEVLKYLGRLPATDMLEVEQFITALLQQQAANQVIAWAICLKSTNTAIGMINFWKIDTTHQFAEIGYSLLPEEWQKGYMHEALQEVLAYGFTSMNLHRIEANIDPLNSASRRLLEKNGFVQEAHFKENYFFEGKFIDSVILAKLQKPY